MAEDYPRILCMQHASFFGLGNYVAAMFVQFGGNILDKYSQKLNLIKKNIVLQERGTLYGMIFHNFLIYQYFLGTLLLIITLVRIHQLSVMKVQLTVTTKHPMTQVLQTIAS